MARVHIHVECVIGILKDLYQILQAWLLISQKKKGDEVTATVDKLLTLSACCADQLRRTCCVI